MRIASPLRPIFVILGAATTVACVWTMDWKERDARAEFAVMVSCPEKRTVSVRRPDLETQPVPPEEPAPEHPSEEVARDKERLAKWQSDQEDARRKRAEDRDFKRWWQGVFEVHGCGRTKILRCYNNLHGRACDELTK